ncbi:hypothetical protein ACFX2B_023357 [Malus domestica]
MVTSAQLQILQSPITSLISTISSSVTVKLDDSNYLTWNFQIELLLEGHGLMGFVDGSHPCPAQFNVPIFEGSYVPSSDVSSSTESDDFKVWKMHDRALMQLLTATLSPSAVSCAIGSSSAHDLWQRLKEQISIVTRTMIFQMKYELQNIKKGTDSISIYLQRIKEARDYLFAAGVQFDDDDIVILTLNGLSSEYNTLRSIIRGRENVISMKDLRSQLLAEEAMVENIPITPFLSVMVARNNGSVSKLEGHSTDTSYGGSSPSTFYSSGPSGIRPNQSKNKYKGKFQYNSQSRFGNSKSIYGNYNSAPGILGSSPPKQQGVSSNSCQICGKFGHFAPTCRFRNSDSTISEGCQICGKKNHSAKYCHFRNSNPSTQAPTALHVSSSQHHQPSAHPQQFWLTDSGASSHMTADLSNMSLASPYPADETIQTASGAGLSISHIGSSTLHTPLKPLQLNSVLCVPGLSQNLLSVHQLCLDNHCWLIYDAFCFWIQDKATGKILFQGKCSNGLYPIPLPVRVRAIFSQPQAPTLAVKYLLVFGIVG